MIKSVICAALCLLSSICHVSAAVEDEAEALVRKTLLKIYNRDLAAVWESFSEPSRNELRKLYLDDLAVRKETWKPRADVPASPYEIRFSTEETRLQEELDLKTPDWQLDLKRRGFPANLDLVKKLDNHDFWETFLSEQFLRDKEYHATVSGWPSPEYLPVSYRVEGVAVNGDRFSVIIMGPPKLQKAFYSLILGTSYLYPWIGERENLPDKRFVWSGRISNGSLQLDVPQNIVDFYKDRSVLRKTAER